MSKNKPVRNIAFVLLILMLLPTFISCEKKDKKPNVEETVNKYNAVHAKHPEDYYIKFTDETEKEIYVPDGVSLDDPEIYREVKDQWREFILGNTDEKAEQSDEYKEHVKKVSADCKAVYNNYKTSGKNPFGYTAANVGTSEKIQTLYGYVYKLAKGYGTVGSDYYHDEKLAEDIEKLLEYFYMHYYGENILKDNASTLKDMYIWDTGDNWWTSDIGIPLSLMPTLLIMEDYLGPDLVARYCSPFDYMNEYPNMIAANRLWIGKAVMASALLQEDCERILKSKNILLKEFVYVDEDDSRADITYIHDKNDGVYSDGSFIQHGNLPYTNGYGMNFLISLTEIMFAFRGTRFEFYEDIAENQYDFIFDTYIPMSYEGQLFLTCGGDNVTTRLVSCMVTMSVYAPQDIKNKLQSVIKYNLAYSDINNFASDISPALLDYMLDIGSDINVVPTSGFDGTHVFGSMDRIVQQNLKYAVCIALNSTRIAKYEPNRTTSHNSLYSSDGAIYVYTDDYDFRNFSASANLYKRPGTTVSELTRTSALGGYNASAFAGGVKSSDSKYAVSVYALEYDGSRKVDYVNTKANKSYFMFDNEIVAVGSGISDGSGKNVYTVIDNRLWRNGDTLTSNGANVDVTKGFNVITNNLHFTNMGGYVLFEDTTVEYNKNGSYLELWIEHGKNPSRARYSYVYLPEAAAEETTAYASSPDVEILTHTDSIHVVRENKLGITGYAFYLAGNANGVTASNKCVIMIEESNGEYKVSISDPTQELSSLTLTLDLPVSELISTDEAASAEFKDGKAVITLNISGNHGQTYTIKLK